jgi:hypothetical protein
MRELAVTDGANGAFWRAGGQREDQAALAVEAIDTLAAGTFSRRFRAPLPACGYKTLSTDI